MGAGQLQRFGFSNALFFPRLTHHAEDTPSLFWDGLVAGKGNFLRQPLAKACSELESVLKTCLNLGVTQMSVKSSFESLNVKEESLSSLKPALRKIHLRNSYELSKTTRILRVAFEKIFHLWAFSFASDF